MPELPEVEVARRNVERVLKGKRLKIVYGEKDDPIVFDRQNLKTIQKTLQSAKVIGSGRKGKYFWLKLDRRPWPVFHLGMSGNIEIRKSGKDAEGWQSGELWSSPHKKTPGARLPRFCRLFLETADGAQIAYTDPRRFGRVRLAQNPLEEAPISLLGFDPLEGLPPPKDLGKILGSRKAPIKAVLLDQSLFAGVGNWVADEVLYQSRISPHRPARSLASSEIARLRSRLLSIVKKAVALEADYKRYPSSWLFQHRWGKGKESYTSRGYEIRHDTIGGRTSAWVPALQK
jgi:formamidopyrimidine-DNA glycosylase